MATKPPTSDEYLMLMLCMFCVVVRLERSAIARNISECCQPSSPFSSPAHAAASGAISEGEVRLCSNSHRFHTSALAMEFPNRPQSPETTDTRHSKFDKKSLDVLGWPYFTVTGEGHISLIVPAVPASACAVPLRRDLV